MDAQDVDTATSLLLASTVSAAVVGLDMSYNVGKAIQHASLTGTRILPDYWPELQQTTELLRELITVLEGTA